jgi:hypothetical protein
MKQEMKLILALQQVDGITKLIKDNEYEYYLNTFLVPIRAELHRQLTNAKQCTTMKE